MDINDEKIRADLYRYFGDISYRSLIRNLIFNSGFRYTYCLRKCAKRSNADRHLNVPFLFWGFLLWIYGSKYHIHISHHAQIGHGLYIGYGEFVTITASARVGNNLNINHGAVIGQTNRGKRLGAPTIGNNVWIGTHAVIVGKIKIGNDALIAPLSHVNFDVPDNAVVAGNPGEIISYSGTSGYVNNRWTPKEK